MCFATLLFRVFRVFRGFEITSLRLNCIDGVRISRSGTIEDLRHQNYHGKRVYLNILDSFGVVVSTKLDIGVHTRRQMPQSPMQFSLALDETTVTLPANSKEQIFAEKLKSLLKLGTRSNRLKDIFDLYYLLNNVNVEILRHFIDLIVLTDPDTREKDFAAISNRIHRIFSSGVFLRRLSSRKSNWLNISPRTATSRILAFINTL
ncbi:MAG: nucleotidyl transferase AbiEii/AbiGii toxin family protein [Kiritimatiellae bacterium]|nr:nucleotidyl transferase AbiEii/AbiGii toxin family protein [Kiritimatiellia bacterium]